MILLSDIVFKLILCIAMLCIFSLHIRWSIRCKARAERFWNILAQSIKQFLGDMRSILPSLHRYHHRLCRRRLWERNKLHKHKLSISASRSKVNQAWNKHEAWVCQGEIKIIFEFVNWTTILLEVMTLFRWSWSDGRFTDINKKNMFLVHVYVSISFLFFLFRHLRSSYFDFKRVDALV